MKVLYIAFVDFKEVSSGSSVRPQRMLEAFEKLGYEVKLVSGKDMFRKGKEERKSSIRNAMAWLKKNRPDYCYVENATSPVKLMDNWKLLSVLHKAGIPIGYFYRDFYYKFPVRIGNGFLKDRFYRMLYARDEWYIRKYADIMYLPSKQCFSFFRHKKKRMLPPGMEIPAAVNKKQVNRCCVYVGGVNHIYGTFMLIEAFRLINEKRSKERRIRLKLVCRKSDLILLDQDYVRSLYRIEWVEMIHAQGDELKPVFKEADVGLIPILKSFYSRQAIPIKISDYISNGLPIISTPLEAEMDFFGSSKVCLFSADDSPREFAKTIIEFFNDQEKRLECQKNVHVFAEKNTWVRRIQQLEEDLIG